MTDLYISGSAQQRFNRTFMELKYMKNAKLAQEAATF